MIWLDRSPFPARQQCVPCSQIIVGGFRAVRKMPWGYPYLGSSELHICAGSSFLSDYSLWTRTSNITPDKWLCGWGQWPPCSTYQWTGYLFVAPWLWCVVCACVCMCAHIRVILNLVLVIKLGVLSTLGKCSSLSHSPGHRAQSRPSSLIGNKHCFRFLAGILPAQSF